MKDLFHKDRPTIMGVLNVTPDSFSDGGDFVNVEDAVARALEMEENGADIIDIGGESSGPGSLNVSLDDEAARILPVLKAIREKVKIPISIDTYKSKIAEMALNEGAHMINDITALRGDEKMAAVVERYKCPVVLMYAKDDSARTTVKEHEYDDVVLTVKEFFKERLDLIDSELAVLDPGMGHFVSAVPRYSYELIARLAELKDFGRPILVGLSRKSFLGGKMEDRDERGLPLSAIAYLNGASIIRTHAVKALRGFFTKFNG